MRLFHKLFITFFNIFVHFWCWESSRLWINLYHFLPPLNLLNHSNTCVRDRNSFPYTSFNITWAPVEVFPSFTRNSWLTRCSIWTLHFFQQGTKARTWLYNYKNKTDWHTTLTIKFRVEVSTDTNMFKPTTGTLFGLANGQRNNSPVI